MSDILMPALSPTMEEGSLAKWHVREGDRIVPGQLIAEIETDKATLEVEAADGGVVEALLVAEGAQGVPIHTPIARLTTDGAQAQAAAASQPAAIAASPAAVDRPPSVPIEATPPPPAFATSVPAKATPLARRLALSAGLSLESHPGSGPEGRILKRDLDAALGLGGQARPAAPTAPSRSADVGAPLGAPLGPEIAPGSYDLAPLDGMRKTIARRMAASFRDVPHFPLTVDIEIDALLALRERLNQKLAADGVKASVNDLMIKAAAATLQRVPDANVSYTPDGIARHRDIDIAFAVAIDGGLITPIIRKASEKGLGEVAAETRSLAERARTRSLAPTEFQGGTFSVSNLGMFGVKSFSSIVNEPQGAILSIGAGDKRPVVRNDDLAIATVMTITLTCDHRAMDGAVAAQWVRVFKSLIEEPMGMLL